MLVPPKMLMIHMNKERAMRLSLIAMALGVRAVAVEDGDSMQTLGALCGLDEKKKIAFAAPLTEEMLVFAFLPDQTLNALLAAIRQSGLQPVRLKAVLTPNNRSWTCVQLQNELMSEAAAFERMKEGQV